MGRVRLQTDRKPLVPLINSYDLDKTPLRCQRLLMRLMRFDVVAEHIPGKQLAVADALSRHPLDGDHKPDTEDQARVYVNTAVASKLIISPKMEDICRATQHDTVLQKVITFIRKGCHGEWLSSHPCEDFAQPELIFLNQTVSYCTTIALSSPQNRSSPPLPGD